MNVGGTGFTEVMEEPPATAPEVQVRALLDGLLDQIAEADRVMSGAAALRAALVDQLRLAGEMLREAEEKVDPGKRARLGADLFSRSLRAELACVLRVSEPTAEAMLSTSRTLLHESTATFAALVAGDISERHARVLVTQLGFVDAEVRPSIEARSIEIATQTTVPQFERRMRELCDEAITEPLRTRRDRAEKKRGVWVTPAADGMAWLEALLPAASAVGIQDRVTQIAVVLGKNADESRTRDQLRADALCDLLIDGESDVLPDTVRGIRPRVSVHVPVLTLLGGDQTARLEGYGPIDAQTARVLCAHAPGFTRLLTDPATGIVLSVGRQQYRPPEELRRWVRSRDGTCGFPGCRIPAARCEIDHTISWQSGGETSAANLAALCTGHHSLKHDGRWKVRQTTSTGGGLTWTSPGGRVYEVAPEVSAALPPF